jgi:hypothetical protein
MFFFFFFFFTCPHKRGKEGFELVTFRFIRRGPSRLSYLLGTHEFLIAVNLPIMSIFVVKTFKKDKITFQISFY